MISEGLPIETAREKLHWAAPLLKDAGAQKILDVGGSARTTAHALAVRGFQVTALLDPSTPPIKETRRTRCVLGHPEKIPLDSAWFDAVLAFDVLQESARPDREILEFSRVLRPGGLLLFQAYSRNVIGRLVQKRGAGWLLRQFAIPQGPGQFVKPVEMERYCRLAHLEILSWEGLQTGWNRELVHAASLKPSYCGVARKLAY